MFYAWANHNKARKCHFPFAKRILWNWNCGISHTIHTHYTHSHTCSHSHAVRSKSKPYVSEALCCSSHKHRKFFRFVGFRKVCVSKRYAMITWDILWYPMIRVLSRYPQDTPKMLFLQNMYQICISDAKFSKEEAAVLYSLRVFYMSSLQCYLSPSVFAFAGY